jgi:hypothetical protein
VALPLALRVASAAPHCVCVGGGVVRRMRVRGGSQTAHTGAHGLGGLGLGTLAGALERGAVSALLLGWRVASAPGPYGEEGGGGGGSQTVGTRVHAHVRGGLRSGSLAGALGRGAMVALPSASRVASAAPPCQ